MVKGTIVKNGKLRLILQGTDNLDKEALRMLGGSTARIITDPLKFPEGTIPEGLVLEIDNPSAASVTPVKEEEPQEQH